MSSQTTERTVVRGALAAAAVLVVTAPTPVQSLRTLRDSSAAVVVTDPLVALVALLAWACAAYLLLLAALTAGSRLPAVGPLLAGVVRRCAPPGLRRGLELALGVTLVVGSLGAGTASAAGPATGSALSAHTAYEVPTAPAPVVAPLPGASPSLDHPVTAPSPSLDHPVAAASPSLDHPVTEGGTPAPDLDWPGAAAPAAAPPATVPLEAGPVSSPTATAPTSPSPDAVVVQPGDSLWALAQERLEQQTGGEVSDAKVAQAWPAWWQANREAVGDDPDLLQPGTPLVPPTDS